MIRLHSKGSVHTCFKSNQSSKQRNWEKNTFFLPTTSWRPTLIFTFCKSFWRIFVIMLDHSFWQEWEQRWQVLFLVVCWKQCRKRWLDKQSSFCCLVVAEGQTSSSWISSIFIFCIAKSFNLIPIFWRASNASKKLEQDRHIHLKIL